VTDAVTDMEKLNFHKQRLKNVGRFYSQEETNKSGHDKC